MTKQQVKKELSAFEGQLLQLPPEDGLEVMRLARKILAAFGVKDSLQRVTVIDLVKFGAHLISASKR